MYLRVHEKSFLQIRVDNPRFPKLSSRVTGFKEYEDGVSKMCATVEKYAEKYAKKYADEARAEEIVTMGVE